MGLCQVVSCAALVRPQPCAVVDCLAISSRCISYSSGLNPKSAGRVGRSGPGPGVRGPRSLRSAVWPQVGRRGRGALFQRSGPQAGPGGRRGRIGSRGATPPRRRRRRGRKGVCAELGRRCPAGAAPESGLSSAEGSGEEPRTQTRRRAPRAAPRRAGLAAPGRVCAACAGLVRLFAQGWAGGEPRPRARGGVRPPAACVGPARAATFWRHLEFRARGRTPAWG